MKKIIAFAGSNSKKSINKQLAIYVANLLDNVEVKVLDLNDYELPLFGVDLEAEIGHPKNAHKFLEEIRMSDGIIVSLAEHNGAYSAVFKNLFDWMSRIEVNTFLGKPMLLMATSNGGRGGKSVLAIAKDRFPRHDTKLIADFSLPKFSENFDKGKIVNQDINDDLVDIVKQFRNAL